MSTPEQSIQPIQHIPPVEAFQPPLFDREFVPPAVTIYDMRAQKRAISRGLKEHGNKYWNLPEQKANRQQTIERVGEILEEYGLPELATEDVPQGLAIRRGRVRDTLERAQENADAHTIIDMDTEDLLTMLRSVESYGSDVIRYFGADQVKLDAGMGQLRAVLDKKHIQQYDVPDYESMSQEETEKHEAEHLALLQAVHIKENADSTFVQPASPVTHWKDMRSSDKLLPQSDFVDGMTLTIALWSLSSMSVRGATEADRESADSARKELERTVAEQKAAVVVQPELEHTEFVDILPAAVGKLVMSEHAR